MRKQKSRKPTPIDKYKFIDQYNGELARQQEVAVATTQLKIEKLELFEPTSAAKTAKKQSRDWAWLWGES